MNLKKIRTTVLCIFLLAKGALLLCQIQGESEAIRINLKKPGNSKEESATMNRQVDIDPPAFQIISPRLDSAQSAHVPSASTYLIGRILDASEISFLQINDSIVPVDENGFFQQQYELAPGLNAFKLTAEDEISNSSTSHICLIRVDEEEMFSSTEESDYPGDFYALLIANNTYDDPSLPDLDNPITDATFLYSTLMGNYTFEPERITLLRNATRADIIRTLDKLSNELTERDNLLIFYAGHGHWDEKKETGYWLPSDAEQSSSVNWIRNSTIQDYVDDIHTRHTLLITDACFAGSIFKTRGAFQDASFAVNKLYSLASRKAMTSGNFKEVPDKSVFIEYFIKRLLENDRKYISSGELYGSFRNAVLNNSPNIPQYGVIQDTGDEGGEFIFIKR